MFLNNFIRKKIYIELALMKQGIGKSINSFSKIFNNYVIINAKSPKKNQPNHRKKISQITEKYFAKSPKKLKLKT